MRTVFLQYLQKQALIDPNLYLIVGDVGFSVIESFAQQFPQRYINAGVAEQAMIGLAAGLAMTGKNVYVYSIIPFITMRCFEQIRIDLCYQHLPVKIVGVGGGLSYGPMGATHHALEDIGIMRILAGMTVIAPANKYETMQLMPQINECTGPAYVRLSNTEESVIYQDETAITLGKAVEIIAHDYQCIITTGNALELGKKVIDYLLTHGISIGLVSMPTIKPLDKAFILEKKWSALFTIEEHFITGGLGNAVAHVISEQSHQKITFHSFGIDDFYFHEAGSRAHLLEKAGLSVHEIAHTIMMKLNGHVLIETFNSSNTSDIHSSNSSSCEKNIESSS